MPSFQPMSRPWFWFAGIGLAIFILLQIIPMMQESSGAESHRTLSRSAAGQKAAAIAAESFGISAVDPQDIEMTYLSDSAAVGYLAQQALFDRYREQWDASHPLEVYRADLPLHDGSDSGWLTLYLHPETGKLVGWQSAGGGQSAAAHRGEGPGQALQFAASWGEQSDRWIWDGNEPDARGFYTFLSRSSDIGEASLLLHVQMPNDAAKANSETSTPWKGGAITYSVQVPAGFTAYLAQQEKLAGHFNAWGFVVPQLLLMIMAIVYAATRKSYTSGRRGMALAALFWVLYAAFYFNLVPGFRAALLADGAAGDPSAIHSLIVVNLIILAIMAVFTYLAAVGGDGLWKSMGRSLWPRWREKNYGEAVLAGMKRGYLLAFLLLGVQSVILAGLGQAIGMFQSSDASQSSYNMILPWLLLLLAWCAGISEEMQSRLFGIGLFRHWLVGGATRLLGRAPSRRGLTLLTAAAMFPPGLFWAFGHVSYAVYPVYSRLIELVILAMLFGWFMLRFGFLSVLFAHIILDSILMSVQLLSDGLPGGWVAGIAGPLLPAIVALLLGWAHRRRAGCKGTGAWIASTRGH